MDLADQGFLAHCCLCRRQPSYNEKRSFHPRAGPADISRNVNVAGGLRSAGTNGRKVMPPSAIYQSGRRRSHG